MAKGENSKMMEEMHGALCRVLLEQLKNDPSPSMLNVARQFLRDNGIDGLAAEGTPLHLVKEAFPFEVEGVLPPKQEVG